MHDGTIGYSAPARPPYFGDSTFAEYHFPVMPGGNNLMTASIGGLDLRATQTVIVQVYNIEDPNSPGDSLYGHSFQFIDGDVSLLKTSGLPSGFKLGFLGADVSLFATDPSLFDPPESAVIPATARTVRFFLHRYGLHRGRIRRERTFRR